MVEISGRGKQKPPKRDIDNFRVSGSKLETIDRSFYLKATEKLMFNEETKEVRIR